MPAMSSTIYMLLFSATIVAGYLIVRLGWLRAYQVFVPASMINSLFFFLFSIARGNGLAQAITVGLGLGLIFTGLSVTLGVTFRSTATVRVTKAETIVAETIKA